MAKSRSNKLAVFRWLLLQLCFTLFLATTPSDAASIPDTPTNALQLYMQTLQACIPNGPLGMSTGAVTDSQISASSTYPANWEAGCSERYGRVYQPNGLAWCAKFKSASEWLQVDLGLPAKVTGVMTQGRADGKEFVTSFVISHSLDGFNWYYVVDEYGNKRVFEGNTDSFGVKHTYLDDVIVLRYIKFHTVTWHRHPSMRVEIIGCHACRTQIALPPYSKVLSSSEKTKNGGSSCAAEYGYLITDKGWCPKHNTPDQWLQFDIGPPKLVTGLVTKGRGDKKHWVTKYRLSYSNDTRSWHFYGNHEGVTEFTGNVNHDEERYQLLGAPFVARYIRFHPVEWNRHIGLRAGLLGCPHAGECSEGFIRVNDNSPCVENLAYKKESFVNSRRQYKRHINHKQVESKGRRSRHDEDVHTKTVAVAEKSAAAAAAEEGGNFGIHSCTVLDNFYVERPVWMVDLGKKTTVSGVIIVTWPGNPNDLRAGYQDYVHNLDKLTVYIDTTNHRNHYNGVVGAGSGRTSSKRAAVETEHTLPDSTVCGARTRAAVATAGDAGGPSAAASSLAVGGVPLVPPFPARIHVPCRQPLQGRYVFVEATGIETRFSRLFGAILCDVIVYQ
jgi:lactadherin